MITALRLAGVTVLLGVPCIMIYAAGTHNEALFFGSLVGGGTIGGLLGMLCDHLESKGGVT